VAIEQTADSKLGERGTSDGHWRRARSAYRATRFSTADLRSAALTTDALCKNSR
jgi:hypothetical protein